MKKEKKKLEWREPLYAGGQIQDQTEFRQRIEKGQAGRDSFLITLSNNPGNQLELFSAIYLRQETFWNLCPPIVGIAGSKADAVQVIQNITEECLEATGNCNLKEYLKNR